MGSRFSKEEDKNAIGDTNVIDEVENLVFPSSLSSKVQLSFSCSNLRNMDQGSQGLSDPFIVVKTRSSCDDPWSEIGRTEICTNTLNPQFVRLITMFYHFEEIQYLRFEVYDADSSYTSSTAEGLDLSAQDFQGAAECALALIVGGLGQSWNGDLSYFNQSNQRFDAGKILVRAEEVPDQNMLIEMNVEAVNLNAPKNALRRTVGTFLRISRTTEGSSPIPCYKSEVVPDMKNPEWKTVKSSATSMCAGDLYRPLLFEIFAYRRTGEHVLYGAAKSSINDFIGKTKDISLEKCSGSVGGGTLSISRCKTITKPSFLDYLGGGMEIGFQCAIDYTGSNGDPSDPNSLHYRHSNGLNEYARAIKDVGGVIEYYDTDKKFPVYGFGGKPYPHQPVQHCFAVNRNESDPEVTGINGILDVYFDSLRTVTLSGPTLFAPVIGQAASLAASLQTNDPSKQTFSVLLILTDGLINDMQNTVDSIVAASELPFSIVIVGVGRADFTSMRVLDADDVPLVNSYGKKAARDIVQFVPLNKFMDCNTRLLAKEVLAEIPQQVVQYMELKGIKPGIKTIIPLGSTIHEVLQERQASFKMWESQRSGLGLEQRMDPPPPYAMR